jgi:hypothetical protein
MPEGSLAFALRILQMIADEDQVIIRFKKKNEIIRDMRCTLKFEKIPKEKRPKDTNLKRILEQIKKNKLLHVYDLDSQDWRSLPLNRIIFIKTSTKTYEFGEKK